MPRCAATFLGTGGGAFSGTGGGGLATGGGAFLGTVAFWTTGGGASLGRGAFLATGTGGLALAFKNAALADASFLATFAPIDAILSPNHSIVSFCSLIVSL